MARTLTCEAWKAEATRRFGGDPAGWRFVCPLCGHVATVDDWKKAGAPETAGAFSCVGRYLPTCSKRSVPPGPCNYTGGGLIRLNPVTVTGIHDDGTGTTDRFEFDGAAWSREKPVGRPVVPAELPGATGTLEPAVRRVPGSRMDAET